MSVKAGLANIERSSIGVRHAQTPPASVSEQPTVQRSSSAEAERAKVERYNKFIQSERFAYFPVETQIAMIESFDLTPEQKAPVIQAIRERVASQKALNKEVKELLAFSPEKEVQTAPTIQQKYLTGQTAGTATLPRKNVSYIETAQGIKMIDWSKYSPGERTLMFSYLEKQQTKKMLNLGLFIAAPVAAAAAPATAAVGAGAGVLFAQGIKGVSGQGWLTPEEALYSAGEGVVFSVVSAGLVRGLGITGKGMRAAASRVGINTAFGAALGTAGEYVSTGTLTGMGTLQGAGFGLAFGVAGEVAQYGVGRTHTHFKGKAQKNIDASYERQIRYNEAVLQGKVKGVTEVWHPSTSERFAMRVYKVSPETRFASQINVARVPAGDMAYDLAAFQRVGGAGELFDFAFVPKSATATQNVPVPQTAPYASKYPIHPVMLSWKEFKADLATVELNAELRQRLIDKGIPESQLAYDYRGETWFEKSPVKQEYAPGKFYRYGWKEPFQQPPKAHKTVKQFSYKEPVSPTAHMGGAEIVAMITAKGSTTMRSGGFTPLERGIGAVAKTGYAPKMWQGTPYYGAPRGGMVTEELIVLSYPKSPLGQPNVLFGTTGATGAMAGVPPSLFNIFTAREALSAVQAQKQRQRELLIPIQATKQDSMQITANIPGAFGNLVRANMRFDDFKTESGFVGSPAEMRRQRAKWFKRTTPILTAEEVLLRQLRGL